MVNPKLPVRRVHTGDRVQDEAQRAAQELTRKVNASPLGSGVLLHAEVGRPDRTGLAFVAGTARSIAHGLGRRVVGFLEVGAVDLPSAGHVGLYATAHPPGVSSATHITVTPASSGTAFVLVF